MSVALTGMAVLIIEISATRILAPYFGNSIFTFSSVISIILAALALGYYAGGRLADVKPSNLLFFGLIVMAGFSVLLLQLLNATFLPAMAYQFSMIHGPLIVSLLMFFLPALLLGMLSPFAIKLIYTSRSGKGVGTSAGLVFFWSTLGSIGGSLAAGFVLIPRFGVSHIVIGVALSLVALGGAGMLIFSRRRKPVVGAVILLGLIFTYLLGHRHIAPGQGIVFSSEGLYEKVVVRDIPYQGRTARILLQNRNINSGMFTDDGRMAFDYTKYFDLYRLFTPELHHALAIGGGAYSVPKAILRDSPATLVDVAEIEPMLIHLARAHFALPDDERISNYVIDGRRFLHDSSNRYDLIFLDVYRSFASSPMQFTTREFFELGLSRLANDGVLIANYYGSLAADVRPMIFSILKTMRSIFPQVYLIATLDSDSDKLQNFIFIGHKASQPQQRIDLRQAQAIKFNYPELNQVATRELQPADELIDAALILTDDFAPVEYYAANAIRQFVANLNGAE